MDIFTQCIKATHLYFSVCLLFPFTGTSSQEVLNYDTAVQRCQLDEGLRRSNHDLLEPGQGYWIGMKRVELGCSAKAGTSSQEVLNYDTAVQRCQLDEGLRRSNHDLLEPGQGYWIGMKRVELGCSVKGVCTQLMIGQSLNSSSQSLDLICAVSSTCQVLTRMRVQCPDGFEVATITSYDDINNLLYNRFTFPTNVSMVINNFNMSGFRTRCGAGYREGRRVRVSYRDCGDLLPTICNRTDESDLLKTLTIIEYSSLVGLGMRSVHLLSIGVAVVLTFIVLIIIIIVLVKRIHHKDNKDPSSVRVKKKKSASRSSNKQQPTNGSRDNMEEGPHYMTIPADVEYMALQQDPVNNSHVYNT